MITAGKTIQLYVKYILLINSISMIIIIVNIFANNKTNYMMSFLNL